MTDTEIIEHLRFEAPTQMLGNLMLLAARRLEQLTAKLETPEGSERIRMAVIAGDGDVQAEWLPYEDSDSLLAIRRMAEDNDINVIACGIVVFDLPRIDMPPTVTAQIESVGRD